jgi:hypothetical protein
MRALNISHKPIQQPSSKPLNLNSVLPCRTARTSKAVAAADAADQAGSMHVKPLVVVGSVNADLVLSVDRLPQPGETLGAKGMSVFPGGKVAAAAMWQATVLTALACNLQMVSSTYALCSNREGV